MVKYAGNRYCYVPMYQNFERIGLSYVPHLKFIKIMGEVIPYLSIKPSFLSVYFMYETLKERSVAQIDNESNLLMNKHSGNISLKGSKRVRNAIDWLLFTAVNKRAFNKQYGKYFNFKINFITLTLASKQLHGDRVIKSKLLNQFLIEAKKKWKIDKYLWRAEAQRNGNIHFHIITDKFIPWWELQATWNRIQNKLGYVDNFCEVHPGKTPNSTDVHSIKKIRNISAYLSKYCTKKSENRAIEGKLWGLSTSLSKLKSACVILKGVIDDELRIIAQKFKNRYFEGDHYSVYYVKVSEWAKLNLKHLYNTLQNYVSEQNETALI